MSPHVSAFAFAVLMVIANTAAAQPVSRAYCGKDGRAHVVYHDSAERTVTAEPEQVGCEEITVAADGQTVGWSVLVENYATAYPIAVAVVVYRDGKKTVFSDDLSIWRWRFIDRGNRLAVLSGPVHGGATVANLYDAHSGKSVATWDGKGIAPQWAAGWEQQFATRK